MSATTEIIANAPKRMSGLPPIMRVSFLERISANPMSASIAAKTPISTYASAAEELRIKPEVKSAMMEFSAPNSGKEPARPPTTQAISIDKIIFNLMRQRTQRTTTDMVTGFNRIDILTTPIIKCLNFLIWSCAAGLS